MPQPAMPHVRASRPSLIEQGLLGAAALALVAMLSLPAARSASETFGWLPFWLPALPLCAWATARALRLREQRAPRPTASVHRLRRDAGVGARTRTPARALPRAA